MTDHVSFGGVDFFGHTLDCHPLDRYFSRAINRSVVFLLLDES